MKKRILPLLLCGALLLSGCGLLRREYTRTEPHSATYYEGDRRDVLRAEGRQDLVNDLLLLVSAHDESGTVWLYDSEDGADASQLAQVACDEVLQETPLGAYALEYLTYTVDEGGRGYTQLRFTAGYRRTAQQIKSIVHATNAAALRDLLQAAVENGGRELAVQVGSFDGSRQYAEQLNMAHLLKTQVGNLSTGERKKASILAGICTDAKLLILDEPSNGLDIDAVLELQSIVSNIRANGTITTILSSHDINMLSGAATKYVYLCKGKIVWQNNGEMEAAEIVEKYRTLVQEGKQ